MSETRRFPPRPFPPPDWRNAKTYRPLLSLDRAAWAWQWLKRNPEFLVSAHQGRRSPRRLPGPHPAPRIVATLTPLLDPRWGVLFRG